MTVLEGMRQPSWQSGKVSGVELEELLTQDEEAFRSTKHGHLPLLNEHVVLDDDGAIMVLVFSRERSIGGTVDPREIIQDPRTACERIFTRRHHCLERQDLHRDGSGFEPLLSGPVSAAVYHSVVRDKVLELLMAAGLEIETFQSIDADEAFVKIWLDPEGEVIRNLAHRFRYRMPFKESAYKETPPEGDFKGGEPMRNYWGYQVPGFVEFDTSIEHLLQGFQRVDVIRLLHMCIDEKLDLNEMVSQNIILRHFPATSHVELHKLHTTWGSLRQFCTIPSVVDDEDVRDFFGESTAFFFRFFRFYVNMLVPLAVVGGACAAARRTVFHNSSSDIQRWLQIMFAHMLVIWASVFSSLFHRSCAYAKQRWGMTEWERFSLERSDYKPELEGSWRLAWKRASAWGCLVLFCVVFVGLIWGSEVMKKSARRRGDLNLEFYSAYITVFLIKAMSFVWVKFAPALVAFHNYRTQAAWNDSLTVTVSSVKLFVSLWPFVQLAFLKKHLEPTCGHLEHGGVSVEVHTDYRDLAEAAGRLYGAANRWPDGIEPTPFVTFNNTIVPSPGTNLDWLMPFAFQTLEGDMCIRGCYPVSCAPSGQSGGMHCVTNCEVQLEGSLMTFYFVHTATTILFLLIPIVLTKLEVLKELAKSRRAKGGPQGARQGEYSLLQFQAKCSQIATYEYYSWGGSEVEDYTELAIGFALLTCFGIALPVMSVFALVSHIVEYRLLAFRMTNVTCRPMPETADGIGIWSWVFGHIGEVAVAVNVAMAVFEMDPMRHWPFEWQLSAFIFLEHVMVVAQKVVKAVIPHKPWDVERIDAFNNRFTNHVLRRTAKYAASLEPTTLMSHRRRSRLSKGMSLGPSASSAWRMVDVGARPL
mmetsp:Transcript_38072/g.100725  ORF Transcript_38072/g.100725 Transcript_38072/m.100725 type:complete len:869 (-) Transcript_38072:66-2672(-)